MKGILFTELLFHKTISGEKTMTRREGELKKINNNPDEWHICEKFFMFGDRGVHALGFSRGTGLISSIEAEIIVKPRYKTGEVVYIKEPVGVNKNDCSLVYMYDYTPESECRITNKKDFNWGNKLFMSAALARYYIKITNVTAERLWNISDEDCLKEGIEYDYDEDWDGVARIPLWQYMDYSNMELQPGREFSAQESFLSLFRFANKIPKNKDIGNPWVFVYSYFLCDKKGNEL